MTFAKILRTFKICLNDAAIYYQMRSRENPAAEPNLSMVAMRVKVNFLGAR